MYMCVFAPNVQYMYMCVYAQCLNIQILSSTSSSSDRKSTALNDSRRYRGVAGSY